ncbi:MAG TPA: TerB family tellurite resistance protein [Pseudomonadales bacterium]
MLKKISQFFDNKLGLSSTQNDDPADHQKRLQLATAALLLEIARADFDITEDERQTIANALQNTFNLASTELDELLQLAAQEVDEAVSLHQFTRLIHESYPPADKKEIIRMLWSVAYANNGLDKYEEAMIRKISDLLYVSHHEFMHAKSLAKDLANNQINGD